MLEIGSKKYRNLQEQVGYNTDQIEKILEVLDGLNIQDNVIAIADLSHILTQDELEIVNRAVAFIVYNDQLFIKRDQDATNAYFDVIFSISGTSVISFNSDEIQVNLTTGALTLVSNTTQTYSKTELDTLLGAKASVSYVDTQLALKANLSGADFTGAITAPSIIENMSGYTFAPDEVTGLTYEQIYAGIVKNGNKLTFVQAVNITRTASQSGVSKLISHFIVPNSVANKLYSTTIAGYSVLAFMQIYAIKTDASFVPIKIYVDKYGNKLNINLQGSTIDDLPLNSKVYLRIETTFLLSENLAF